MDRASRRLVSLVLVGALVAALTAAALVRADPAQASASAEAKRQKAGKVAQSDRTARLDRRIRRVVTAALAQRGVPYRWGGSSPGGFDCSGLVRYAYERAGLSLPHSSYLLAKLGRRVSRGALRRGDLIVFSSEGHVGIYVGRGRFVHAPSSGSVVKLSSLDDAWYASAYETARRILVR